jgi:hypothetical protein
MSSALLAHTATKLSQARGRVVVSGSHGGAYPGLLAVTSGVRGILLNDAGVGRDDAGIAGLKVCAAAGIPAAALDHRSCRIGNADDAYAEGVVSHANKVAAHLGVAPGMTAREAAERLEAAPDPAGEPPAAGAEHRTVEGRDCWRIVLCDSASLIRPGEDDGAIVVTGSHGGLVGDDPESAGRAEAALFAFNDAGIGKDEAGVSRLPVLQSRGIPAVCVDCRSARIGEGRSTYAHGIISRFNAAARSIGASAGRPLADLVAHMVAERR